MHANRHEVKEAEGQGLRMGVGNFSLGGHLLCCQRESVVMRRPSVATLAGKTWQPDLRIDSATFSRDSGSVRKTTQPPPPAPQTLAESAPFCRAALTVFSIRGVVIPGALVLRSFHSSRMRRATFCQSASATA